MAIEGMKDVLGTFKRMEDASQLRAMRSALNASMTPIVGALRRNAPKGSLPHRTYKGRTVAPGFLSRSIVKSTRIARDKSKVFGNVRLRSEAWYGSLIEHGWRPGRRNAKVRRESKNRRGGALSDSRLKELGDTRTKIPGRPWFGPTVEQVDDEAAEAFLNKMGQAIIREWLK